MAADMHRHGRILKLVSPLHMCTSSPNTHPASEDGRIHVLEEAGQIREGRAGITRLTALARVQGDKEAYRFAAVS
jgi:hypothetical protein